MIHGTTIQKQNETTLFFVAKKLVLSFYFFFDVEGL